MRVTVRGFAGKQIVFKETVDVPDDEEQSAIALIADRHIGMLSHYPQHVIEMEFLDEPDPDKRFFRFGTDPSNMRMPIKVDLEDA